MPKLHERILKKFRGPLSEVKLEERPNEAILMRRILPLLAILILAGCVSQNSPYQANQTNAPPAAQNQTSPAPQNLTPPAAQSTQPNQSATPNPYSGKDFAALTKLDAPLKCQIGYVYQGKWFTSTAYLRGAGDIRVESVGGSGLSQCAKTITIVQGMRTYVGCENKTVLPSCDWFVSSYNPQVPGQSSTFDFSMTSPGNISCSDWQFDPSYFLAQGRTCSLG